MNIKVVIVCSLNFLDAGWCCSDNSDEAIEHCELHFQFEAVDQWLEGCLDIEVVGVFQCEKRGVKEDGNGIDENDVENYSLAARTLEGENRP